MMNQTDDAESHLTKVLVHVSEVKQVILIAAVLVFGWVTVVNIAVFTDPNSAFRIGQNLGFWDLVLSATQRMGFWLLSATVLLLGWVLLTLGELYVAISAIEADDIADDTTDDELSRLPDPPTGPT